MDETVTLKASRWQFLGLTSVYCFMATASVVTVSSLAFLLLILVALLLFWLHDFKRFSNDQLQLRIRADGNIILWHLDTETCYPECRMYYNRWCMVLKLKNSEHSRSVVLTADRFEDTESYASARYQLCRFEDNQRVA